MRSELETIDHVLRGALNTAMLNLQLVSTSVGRDEQTAPLLDRARAEIRRVAEVLLPAGFSVLGLEASDVRPLDVRQLVEETLAQHALGPVVVAAGPWPAVVADAALLATAIAHLARNAVAATPAEGPVPQVAVDTSVEGEVALVVRNTCAGTVPPLGEDGTPVARGHIGGVTAVVRIARLHGGALRFERQDRELVARLSIPNALRDGQAEPGHQHSRARSARVRQSVWKR
jgi:light-regulated signal transduction histidine kinase (bacteriophytochrome)